MEVLSTGMEAAGTMMCGMSHTRMHGHIKADDDDTGVNVGMRDSRGVGNGHGRRVVGMWECVEMEKSRCV